MNAGLTNVKTLRQELMPPELRTNDKFDALFARLGIGVLAEIEAFLNRQLVRAVSAEIIVSANREFICVPRYPIEGTPTVTVKEAGASSYSSVTIDNVIPDAGMILLGSHPGSDRGLVKVVWTGGYWVDTSANGDGTLPTGAAMVPDALRHAWITQCAHEAEMRRIIGGEMAVQTESGAAVRLGPDKIKLLSLVEATLRPWQRMAN